VATVATVAIAVKVVPWRIIFLKRVVHRRLLCIVCYLYRAACCRVRCKCS
jgi:hypothetical protein